MAESFPVRVGDPILSEVLPQDALVMYAASQQGFVDATKAVHHKADYRVTGDGWHCVRDAAHPSPVTR